MSFVNKGQIIKKISIYKKIQERYLQVEIAINILKIYSFIKTETDFLQKVSKKPELKILGLLSDSKN